MDHCENPHFTCIGFHKTIADRPYHFQDTSTNSKTCKTSKYHSKERHDDGGHEGRHSEIGIKLDLKYWEKYFHYTTN